MTTDPNSLSAPPPAPHVRALAYERAPGRILYELRNVALDVIPDLERADRGILVTDEGDEHTWYVKNGRLEPRPEVSISKQEIIADGQDSAVISLPGTLFIVTVDDQSFSTTSTFELATDMPGTYQVSVDHFPYLPFTTLVTAT